MDGFIGQLDQLLLVFFDKVATSVTKPQTFPSVEAEPGKVLSCFGDLNSPHHAAFGRP